MSQRTIFINEGDNKDLTHYNIIKFRYLNTIIMRHSLLILTLLVIFFLWGFIIVDGNDDYNFEDSMYFMFTTVSSIGYGPQPVPNKSSVACYAFFGSGIIFCMFCSKMMRFKDSKLEAKLYGSNRGVEIQEVMLNNKLSIDEKLKGLTEIRCEGIRKMIKKSTQVFTACIAALIFIILFGSLVFMGIEKVSFEDSFYWTISTITTIGFGEVLPKTSGGIWYNIIFGFITIPCSVIIFDEIAMFYYRHKWQLCELEFASQTESMNAETYKAIRNCSLFKYFPNLQENQNSINKAEFIIANLFIAGKLDLNDVGNALCHFDKIQTQAKNEGLDENYCDSSIAMKVIARAGDSAPAMTYYETSPRSSFLDASIALGKSVKKRFSSRVPDSKEVGAVQTNNSTTNNANTTTNTNTTNTSKTSAIILGKIDNSFTINSPVHQSRKESDDNL